MSETSITIIVLGVLVFLGYIIRKMVDAERESAAEFQANIAKIIKDEAATWKTEETTTTTTTTKAPEPPPEAS